MCSMIIPGLSGSFVLLLMGNYKLVMVDSLTALSSGQLGESLRILVPVGIGAVLGMVLLARFLSWLFRNHHDMAVALITGFIAGSLLIIWPWKDQVPKRNADGLDHGQDPGAGPRAAGRELCGGARRRRWRPTKKW